MPGPEKPVFQPLVSVVVCVYNAGEYLRQAIESVLNQTYRNLEIIVVDDGSTDGCVNAVKALLCDERIVWLHQENLGKSAAMNRAIAFARGKYYAIQDADDESDPHRIQRQVRCCETQDVAGVFCGHELIIGKRRMAPRFRQKTVEQCRCDIAKFQMPAHDPTGMYNIALVRDVTYDATLCLGEGLDYVLRIGERLPLFVMGECLYSYRIHQTSLTKRDPSSRFQQLEEVLRMACSRRGCSSEDVLARFRAGMSRMSKNQIEDNNLAVDFIESALDQRRSGRHIGAIRTAMQSLCLHPLDPHYYKALVYSVSPWWLARRWRQSGVL